ncbi:MAG: FeoB-associated Cys-rich membrane protein [Clostridium sp.]|nr:FeoB-associated Cys-rich membrane protein [Clostridium sp.]
MEILITILLVLIAAYIILKNIKKSSKGCSDCSNCSSHCSKYKK